MDAKIAAIEAKHEDSGLSCSLRVHLGSYLTEVVRLPISVFRKEFREGAKVDLPRGAPREARDMMVSAGYR